MPRSLLRAVSDNEKEERRKRQEDRATCFIDAHNLNSSNKNNNWDRGRTLMLTLRCGTCRYRRVGCDGAKPFCSPCRAVGFNCSGYDYAASPGTNGDKRGVLMRLHPQSVPDMLGGGIVFDPMPQLYNEAQIIFDGVHYYPLDEIGDDTALTYQSIIKRIYINLLVTSASVHRAVQQADTAYATSSALLRREHDLYAFRVRALEDINNRLSEKDTQTSDSTLMSVICLLLSTMQQSAYGDWRAHLEGARRIIQIRGGLKEVISKNAYFKPLLAFFVAIDVMGATTAPSTHKHMYAATTMALHYWEVEPGIFQSNLAISMPCPEELFQTLILINYLRAISRRVDLASRRRAGTRMVLEKLQAFSAPQWAMKMKYFRGWKTSGDGVQFEDGDDDQESPRVGTESSPSTAGSRSQDPTPGPARPSPRPKRESPDSPPEPGAAAHITDLWLNVAIAYRSAILLYAVRTLLTDLPDDKGYLFNAAGGGGIRRQQDLDALSLESRRALAECLVPIFADAASAHDFGKLVYFPMFVCGMELDGEGEDRQQRAAQQDWVTRGLETVGMACGTLGPISAADELRGYWAASAESRTKRGEHVTWDGWFEGRPDFIFGF